MSSTSGGYLTNTKAKQNNPERVFQAKVSLRETLA